MSQKLDEILDKIEELKKENPYNYCDRWCERCPFETQSRCILYQNEWDQKLTCIAHGREEDDPEITKAVMERQVADASERLDDFVDEDEELTEVDITAPEFDNIRPHIEFVENHSLPKTAKEYLDRAHSFLEETFYGKEVERELKYHFQTLSWYHTLLPVKLQTGLAGFHEPACEGDTSLYHAVGQFEVCKKAIRESVIAFRKVQPTLPAYQARISALLALLHNLYDRIQSLEESV